MIAMRTKLPGLSVRMLVCSFDIIGPLFFKILLSVKLIIMTRTRMMIYTKRMVDV